jgi:hypothetical protein
MSFGKYRVKVTETLFYYYDVEAESEEDAIDQASELHEESGQEDDYAEGFPDYKIV